MMVTHQELPTPSYCVQHWLLEDKVGEGLSVSARGCLHRLGVKVIGHRDGS